MDAVAAGRELDKEMRLLLALLPAPPPEDICMVVAQHEHDVQVGRYESLVTTTAKFDSTERALAFEPAFRRDWEQIKATWPVKRFRDHKGIIRRTLTAERNLQPEFRVKWTRKPQRFQAAFDAFCFRWNLYGMQEDEPLLMKLSVNLTPHGTMIFIPSYWSFDAGRDVKWGEVGRIHRARASKRQGKALAEGIEQRRCQAEKLRELDREARELKLKGERRHRFLCEGLGLDIGTDAKRLARLRKEFPHIE
jgi:plastocyanin